MTNFSKISGQKKRYSLAVISPALGTRSETFIYRHMAELLPGQTAVIVRRLDPNAKDLNVEFPYHVLGKSKKNLQWLYRAILYLTKINILTPTQFRVEQYLRHYQVQIVLSQYLDQSLKWLKVAQKMGIKFFAHAHGYDISQTICDPSKAKCYLQLETADGVITMSEYSRKKLIALGLSGDNIHVVPYGINVPDRDQRQKNHETIRCIAVGRMVGKKAPRITLEAFRRALTFNPKLRLDYIGDGRFYNEAIDFVNNKGLQNKIFLHGSQSNEYVNEMMKNADIFLQHSRTDPLTGDEEGLPVAILEAMANSLPVVSTRHAGIPEAVLENTTGYLVDEGDAENMARYIVKLADEAGLRRQMGRKGWERAKSNFSWDKEKESLLKLFNLPIASG